MHKWSVRDRSGRDIYLTKERLQHIVSQHCELQNHLEDVLKTVRRGKRRQQPQDPQTFVYRLPCGSLRPSFNGILVVVAFRFALKGNSSETSPNNFIVTAWGIMMRS